MEWYLELPAISAEQKANGGEFTYGPNEEIPEPLLYFVAQCDNQILKVHYFDIEMTKDDINQFLVISDIILTVLLVLGILTISNM